MINAKPISSKFWILKEGSAKIGEVNNTQSGFALSIKGKKKTVFQTLDMLKIKTGIVFSGEPPLTKNTELTLIHGYPVLNNAYNAVWDLKLRLPLYTRTQDSKSWFAAGYYSINIRGKWKTILSPKLIILERNTYHGPYKSSPSNDSYQ
jgi:hypothetical protein